MSATDLDLPTTTIELWKPRIEAQLDHYTRLDCPARLREAIRYTLLCGGKRLRPLLVLASAQACGGDLERALPAACAVEMIHTYSLIHDDLPAMDDDDTRRGKPSCHIQFGEATAILAGDALIALAFEVIGRDISPATVAQACTAALANAAGACWLVGGQEDDLHSQNSELGLEPLQRIHERKTGALFAVSMKLGALTSGAAQDRVEAVENYGKYLGLAFQIIDDLLDLRGQEATIGKRIGKDWQRGKRTYPALVGRDASEALAREFADRAIRSLHGIGDSAGDLCRIAEFVVDRNH
jgi:geranylgeranyl diphosphate synthase type II